MRVHYTEKGNHCFFESCILHACTCMYMLGLHVKYIPYYELCQGLERHCHKQYIWENVEEESDRPASQRTTKMSCN